MSYGSIHKGLVSQQLINSESGDDETEGVLLKGLVLNIFHKPDSMNKFFKLFLLFSKSS